MSGPALDDLSAVPPQARAAPVGRRPLLWNRAPGWIFLVLCALGAAGILVADSVPSGDVAMFLLSFLWLVLCGGIWLVRGLTYLIGRSSPRPSGPAWPFLLAPAGGLLVLALLWSGAPLQVRWALSREAFDDRADLLVAVDGAVDDGRLGLYHVEDSWTDDDGNAFFELQGSGFLAAGGVVRIGDEPPTDYALEHLDGGWYTFASPFD